MNILDLLQPAQQVLYSSKLNCVSSMDKVLLIDTIPSVKRKYVADMDDFEGHYEASMDDLEALDDCSLHKTDSDSELAEDKTVKKVRSTKLSNTKDKQDNGQRVRTTSTSSSDSCCTENDESASASDSGANANNLDPFRSPEAINTNLLLQPFLIPFQDRRRLSQCREEDEEDVERQTAAAAAAAANAATAAKATVTGTKHKFIVTKTEHLPRQEAENLRNLTHRQNAATIHFPCSSAQQRTPLMDVFFSPQREFNPHMDKRFFDTSLVEIRTNNTSTQSLHKSDEIVDSNVWVPRSQEARVSLGS